MEKYDTIMENNETLTVKEAAKFLGLSVPTVRKCISENLLPATKYNGKYLIDKKNLLDFVLDKETVENQSNVAEPILEYTPISTSTTKKKLGFNSLSPSEWAKLSKNVVNEDEIFNNVWNDLSSPRNKYQLEHGAVYPLKLAERIIRIYSKEGDTVFDPFLGIGTSVIAAHHLNRHAVGIELNPKFAQIAQEWLKDVQGMFPNNEYYKIIQDDCRNLEQHVRKEKVQITITSPPYADFIHKSIEDRSKTHKKSVIRIENNSTVKPYSADENDFGNLSYPDFLNNIKAVLAANLSVTKHGGYSAWVVKDYRDTKKGIPYISFHSDLAQIGQEVGWKFHDLIIWDQTGQRRLVLLGFPSVFYTNQNCSFIVVFRKV